MRIFKKIRAAVGLDNPLVVFCRRHLMMFAAVCLVGLLFIWQHDFVITGDCWAEGFPEYLGEATGLGWGEVVSPSNWIGYMTVIPSFLSKLYISLGFLPGNTDIFYRFTVMVFAVLCIGFIAHHINRPVLRSDLLRLALAGITIVLFRDVSSFSFINVWYIGFVPIILVTLNPKKILWTNQATYAAFGIVVALSKPSFILIPFVAYRAWKTKEYVSNGLIMAALLLQTCLIVAASNSNSTNIFTEIRHTITVTGMEFLKFLHIMPQNGWYIVLANVLLAIGMLVLWRARGFMTAALMAWGIGVAGYSYVVAAGDNLFQPNTTLGQMYLFGFKAQQELMLYILFLLCIFLIIPATYEFVNKRFIKKMHWPVAMLNIALALALVVFCAVLYQRIDVYRMVSIDSYRHSINASQTVCVPLVVPSPQGLDVGWIFSNRATCRPGNMTKQPDQGAFVAPKNPDDTKVTVQSQDGYILRSIVFVVRLAVPETILLQDTDTKVVYAVKAYPSHDNTGLFSFNLAGLGYRKEYNFTLITQAGHIQVGHFQDGSIAYYPFFAEYPEATKGQILP